MTDEDKSSATVLIQMPPTECLHCWLCAIIIAHDQLVEKDHDGNISALVQLLAELVTLSPDFDRTIQHVREQLTSKIAEAQAMASF